MKRVIIPIIFVIFTGISAVAIYVWHSVKEQGLSDERLIAESAGKIKRDEYGTIKIEADHWTEAIELQGFAAASERLFQMDLMRRKADGSLAELFGKKALEYDRRQRLEDWRHYATTASDSLIESQKSTCDAYARGVNAFIDKYPRRWGLEYALLRTNPAPWSCSDSLLIVMLMADSMSRAWDRDLDMKKWRDAMPEDWWRFVFPLRHPWNQLWFDPAPHSSAETIPTSRLPKKALRAEDFQIDFGPEGKSLNGSNSWAYRNKDGAWLANDPHLSYQVPQLWIPTRLATTTGWWIVGTALPGVPGVLIGMNQHLAWSLTNTGEDIDDAVIVPEDSVIASDQREIKIKGQSSEMITVRKSVHGPIVRSLSDQQLVARQWLVLKPGILTLPIERLNHATDWETFNSSIDEFRITPLNFTMLDRSRNMGLRVSGCDIERTNNGAFAESAQAPTWGENCQTANRRRLLITHDNGQESAFISTANERLWNDDHLHNWADDDRASRIRDVLSQSPRLTTEDMRLLQLDTKSRFHREVLQWLIRHGQNSFLTTAQKKDWESWDGDSRACSLCMSEADDAARIFDEILMRTVSSRFSKEETPLPRISREMKRARVVMSMERPEALAAFGIDPSELATGIMKNVARVSARQTKPWQARNHWKTQHPFVSGIPFLGRIFAVDQPDQFGSPATLRSEKPTHGPSTRLIWRPDMPEQSLWAFPTGVSGHALSKHYKDWSFFWQAGAMIPVPANH